LPTLDPVQGDGKANPGSYTTNVSDPMAIGTEAPVAGHVPDVPDLDRPIQVELRAVKQFFDQDAAVFVDAREPEEYAEGHIRGAILMPYDEVSAAPERIENLDTGGRPIIAYCGGGTCEVSINLAWDLIYGGHSKVLVYMGGYPEWAAAGYPVGRGP
jgi:rhodanese-related sulfurtransferase